MKSNRRWIVDIPEVPWRRCRMAGKIIGCTVYFGCAILFYCIGIYAQKCKKPMWFWSGSEVDPKTITDIGQYNCENARMWKLYSLWYFAAGVAAIWNTVVAVVLLVLSCTLGLVILVATYNKIHEKYRVK
jgi:hypothetical protein